MLKRKHWKPRDAMISSEMVFSVRQSEILLFSGLALVHNFLSQWSFHQIRNLDTFEMLKHIKSHFKHFIRLLITKIFCCFCWEMLLVLHIEVSYFLSDFERSFRSSSFDMKIDSLMWNGWNWYGRLKK